MAGRPPIGLPEALALVQRHWGLRCTIAEQLEGYDDTNLRVSGPDGCYLFKVHNASDSVPTKQYAEAQNALLRALEAEGFPVPVPLPLRSDASSSSNSGADSASDALQASPSPDGLTLRITLPLLPAGGGGAEVAAAVAPAVGQQRHAARLLTWLPGQQLVAAVAQAASNGDGSTVQQQLYRELGALLARVDRALQGWQWEPTGVLRRPHAWNLLYLHSTYAGVRPDLLCLPGLDVPLLDAVVEHFQRVTTSSSSGVLRQGIIHSDANERNVLVVASLPSPSSPSCLHGPLIITGLVDWGDASWQWLAAEPAIAAVYAMLLDCNVDDPLPAGAAVLQGYESELALLPQERAVLRTLCMGRLAQSLSLGARAAAAEPGNAEYLLGTQRHGWRLLRLLWGMADQCFLQALGLAAAPAGS